MHAWPHRSREHSTPRVIHISAVLYKNFLIADNQLTTSTHLRRQISKFLPRLRIESSTNLILVEQRARQSNVECLSRLVDQFSKSCRVPGRLFRNLVQLCM